MVIIIYIIINIIILVNKHIFAGFFTLWTLRITIIITIIIVIVLSWTWSLFFSIDLTIIINICVRDNVLFLLNIVVYFYGTLGFFVLILVLEILGQIIVFEDDRAVCIKDLFLGGLGFGGRGIFFLFFVFFLGNLLVFGR